MKGNKKHSQTAHTTQPVNNLVSNISNPVSEAEALFFEIFNSTNEAIIINDFEGNILAANDFAAKLFGFQSESEFTNNTIENISAGGRYNLKAAMDYWEVARKGTPQCFEWLAKKKNQDLFWVEVSLRFISFRGSNKIFALVRDINKRKKIEEALVESENFLRDAQNIAHIGIYKMDVTTGYWKCSEVLDSIFGIDTNYNKNVEGWAAIIHPEWQQTMVDYFTNYVVNQRNRFDKEYKIIRLNDGEERWVHGLGDLTFDEKGNTTNMIGTIRDITERKIYEETIEKVTAEQSAMLANIADVIAIIDKNGYNTYKSPNVEKWFGWKPEELIGKNTWENIHPDDRQANIIIFSELLKEKNAIKISECRYLCKNGTYKWIEYTASNHLNSKYINGILLNYHDISERKKAIDDFQAQQLFSKAVLDSLPGIFYLYSYPELKLKQWNKNHEIQLGFTHDEMVDRYIMDWHIPEARTAVQEAVDFVMQKGMNSIEANLVAKDGKQIPYLLTGVRFEMNSELFLVGVGIDIIKRKEFELQLIEKSNEITAQNEEYLQLNQALLETNDKLIAAKEKAEESDKLKTAFLQNMSHEIRTPMNAIVGFSELMINAYNNKPKLEYYSQIVNRRCNDLLSIINDILDFSKIESGQLTVNKEKCNISSLFSEIHTFFIEQQKLLDKQHISFSLVIPENLVNKIIITDAVKLKQILINLIGNAFKFTYEGKIECGCELEDANHIVFYVSDTGIGIPKDKHEYIFERFAQHQQDSKVIIGGTGLGLSIVRGLTNLLGGKIQLESEPDKGSTFSIVLPCICESESKSEKAMAKSGDLKFHNQLVLVVEDDQFNLAYLKEILIGLNFTVIYAENGREAVSFAINRPVELILMDIKLPDINGLIATNEILKIKPNAKIIAQTAYATNDDKKAALKAGCIDFISKPIKREALIALLSQHLVKTN